MSDIDDVFVGADAIVSGHIEIRDLLAFHGESITGMGRAGYCALFFGPAQGVQSKSRPMALRITARINLLLQAQQTEMAGLMRAEAGDLDVIAEQVGIARNFVHLAAEELLLIIETRAPGQVASDFQVFAQT